MSFQQRDSGLEITFDSLIQRKAWLFRCKFSFSALPTWTLWLEVISPQVVAETALCHGSLKASAALCHFRGSGPLMQADAMPLWNVVGNAARKSATTQLHGAFCSM